MDAKRRGQLEGINLATNLNIIQLMFVDDILLFCNGTIREAVKLSAILLTFCKATGMILSEQKSTLTTFNLDEDIVRRLLTLFPFLVTPLDDGLKYLGFRLKPNCYKKED